MQISILDTHGATHDTSILKDIGMFKTLPEWLEAVKDSKATFNPLNCAVKICDTGEWLYIIKDGCTDADAEKNIEKIKKQEEKYLNLPNDRLLIRANHLDMELLFRMCCPTENIIRKIF